MDDLVSAIRDRATRCLGIELGAGPIPDCSTTPARHAAVADMVLFALDELNVMFWHDELLGSLERRWMTW